MDNSLQKSRLTEWYNFIGRKLSPYTKHETILNIISSSFIRMNSMTSVLV